MQCASTHWKGSVAELEKWAGRKLENIHGQHISDIEIPDPRGGWLPTDEEN